MYENRSNWALSQVSQNPAYFPRIYLTIRDKRGYRQDFMREKFRDNFNLWHSRQGYNLECCRFGVRLPVEKFLFSVFGRVGSVWLIVLCWETQGRT